MRAYDSLARFNPAFEDRFRPAFDEAESLPEPAGQDAGQQDASNADAGAAPLLPGESLRALPPPEVAVPPLPAAPVSAPVAAEVAPVALPVDAAAPVAPALPPMPVEDAAAAPEPMVSAPAAPAEPVGFTGEAAVDPAWLQQREAALQATRSDYGAARAAAQATVGGPGWHAAATYTDESGHAQNASGRAMTFVADPNGQPQIVSYDESGPVYGAAPGTWYEFDEADFAAQYQAQGGAPLQTLASLYGTDVPTLFAQHPGLWTIATSDHALTDGPPPPGRAMADATQLGMVDLYLSDPQVQALIQTYGGEVPPPTNKIGQEQVRLYGAQRYAQMTGFGEALNSVREQFSAAYANAQRNGGPGWIEKPRMVMLSDEGGPAAPTLITDESGAPVMDRVFDPAVFTEWYTSQPGLANQAFKDFYGAAHLSEVDGMVHFDRSDFFINYADQAARMGNLERAPINPGSPPRLNNDQAVAFDPAVGWITPRDNIHQSTDWFEKAVEIGVTVLAGYGAGVLFGPMVSGGLGVSAAVGTGIAAGAAGSIVSGAINGNLSLKGVLTGALAGGLTAGLTSTLSTYVPAGPVGTVAVQATVQGGIQALLGGRFEDGALAGFASGLAQVTAQGLDAAIDQAVASQTLDPTAAATARQLARMVGSAIRTLGHPGDPGYGFASAFMSDLVQQAGNAANNPAQPPPGLPSAELPPDVLPPVQPPAEPPAVPPVAQLPPEASPPSEPAPAPPPPADPAVPPSSLLGTVVDDEGHLMPGIVDGGLPPDVQQSQLQAQLQARGYSPEDATSIAGSALANADDGVPWIAPVQRVVIEGKPLPRDDEGNRLDIDTQGNGLVLLKGGGLMTAGAVVTTLPGLSLPAAGTAVTVSGSLLRMLGVGGSLLLAPGNLFDSSTLQADIAPGLRFEQHPSELYGRLLEQQKNGDWQTVRDDVRLYDMGGQRAVLSDAELARLQPSLSNTPPVLPPGAVPPLPVATDPPQTQVPGYPGTAPAAPPLEGLPAQPMSPEDLLIESRSKQLGRNLEASGIAKPAPEYEAHHLVPDAAGGPRLLAVRQKLAALGIRMDDAVNGMWLPGPRSVPLPDEPAYHRTLNNDDYNNAVADAFESVSTAEEAIAVLDKIRVGLSDKTFPGVRPRP